MNANAYGGQLEQVLEWVEVTTLAAQHAREGPGARAWAERHRAAPAS